MLMNDLHTGQVVAVVATKSNVKQGTICTVEGFSNAHNKALLLLPSGTKAYVSLKDIIGLL